MPERIRLSRAKGWRKPAGASVVARPTKWGNPYVVGSTMGVDGRTHDGLIFDGFEVEITPAIAVELYRQTIDVRLSLGDDPDDEEIQYVQAWRDALQALRGKDLACWCPLDQPCHADVLLEVANA